MSKKGKNAIKWVEELLVTEEKQGVGELGDSESGFCCLGLGCDILDIDYLRSAGTSSEFQKKVGLLSCNGAPIQSIDRVEEIDYYELSFLNDEEGKNFKEIGEILKTSPGAYFEENVAEEIREYFSS